MLDSSLFVLGEEKMKVFMLIYVDDILLTGSNIGYIHDLIQDLNIQFSVKNLGELNFFLRIETHRSERGLHICQAKYASELLLKAQK